MSERGKNWVTTFSRISASFFFSFFLASLRAFKRTFKDIIRAIWDKSSRSIEINLWANWAFLAVWYLRIFSKKSYSVINNSFAYVRVIVVVEIARELKWDEMQAGINYSAKQWYQLFQWFLSNISKQNFSFSFIGTSFFHLASRIINNLPYLLNTKISIHGPSSNKKHAYGILFRNIFYRNCFYRYF